MNFQKLSLEKPHLGKSIYEKLAVPSNCANKFKYFHKRDPKLKDIVIDLKQRKSNHIIIHPQRSEGGV